MRSLRIGTRASPLALAQVNEVVEALLFYHPDLKGRIEIIPFKTTGDTIIDRSLTDVGGKSLFTKEIEIALLNKTIDLAVHSMKDVSAALPPGLIIPVMLKREDPREALITHDGKSLQDLPPGALFGTSSLRRQAYVLHKYPHLTVTSLRGNISTRLEKVEKGEIRATLLAVAGLKRLGIYEKATEVLELDECLPAVAQGAIGIQCGEKNKDIQDILKPLNHLATFLAVSAERAFMMALNGSCRTPIAAYAYLDGEMLIFRGMVSDPQGQNMQFLSSQGPGSQAQLIGQKAAQDLRHLIKQNCFT